jgi:hypothetical protein
MALPITGGDQKPVLKYNAKSAKWKIDDAVHNTISMIVDMDNVEVGWMRFSEGMAPDFIMIKASDYDAGKPFPSRPDLLDKDGKPIYRRGFRVMIKLPDRLAGNAESVREWASNSLATCRGFDRLHDLWKAERDKHPGKLPVVISKSVEAIPGQFGENYMPVFGINKWMPRPDDMSEGANPSAAPPSHVTDPIGEPEEFGDDEVIEDFAA